MKTKFEFSAKAHPDTWRKRSLSLSGVGEGYSLFGYQIQFDNALKEEVPLH